MRSSEFATTMSSSSSSLNVQASWADQDVDLPHVSGNPGGAAGAPAAAVSYAGCTKKNLPEQDVGLTHEERELYDRYLSSSKFEKDNFHPYNTPPDRPCSAFFHLPEHLTTVKDIFDGLLRDGFPASSVRCLQRLPNDGVLVTFSSEEVRNRFLRKSSLIIRKRISVVHPASRRLTFVNVYDAPYELPDSAIEERLKPYGRIYSHRRGKVQGYPDVFNGVRHLRMALEDDIPCFLRFGRFQVRVKYENQPKTCRKCNSPDQLAKECTAVVCFNCDGTGHLSRSCPDGMRCCICKSKEHVAVDCIHSWYRRPQTIDLADDLATGDPEDALDGRPVGDGPPPLEELPEDPPLLLTRMLALGLQITVLPPGLLPRSMSWTLRVWSCPTPPMLMRCWPTFFLLMMMLMMMEMMVMKVNFPQPMMMMRNWKLRRKTLKLKILIPRQKP